MGEPAYAEADAVHQHVTSFCPQAKSPECFWHCAYGNGVLECGNGGCSHRNGGLTWGMADLAAKTALEKKIPKNP